MRHAILHEVKATVPYQFHEKKNNNGLASLSAWPEAMRAIKNSMVIQVLL